MGAESLALGLLVLTSINLQLDTPFIPVAEAAELPAVTQEVIPSKVPPILEKVAFCESGGRQYDRQGRVIRGRVDKRDIGKWQINTYWNGAEAERLGYDVFTLDGNTKMALHLYNMYGLQPWKASKSCWSVPS